MAGKDHTQKGGSRDVANAIYRKVLQKQPPFHSPYEFILVNGTKMSSSKGVGSSAREIADLLPAELLRFLMLRTQPRSVINFAPNYETTTRLFRDYDTLINKYGNADELVEELMPLFYAQVGDEVKKYQPFDFSTLISLLQVPRLNIQDEVKQRSLQPLSAYDQEIVNQRIAAATKWLADYADEEEKLVLYLEQVPEKANDLNAEQVGYLQRLMENLQNIPHWDGEELQTLIFLTTKELGIQQAIAFKALYLSFLNKERGPKAGGLLSYLDKSFVLARLQEVVALNLDKVAVS
jgi:lysyl-tRNA synthetase class 1